MDREDFFSDSLDKSWLGEVVRIDDPTKSGKIKVKVYGKFDLLSIEDIPWAFPHNLNTAGSKSCSCSFSVPKIGSIVAVTFDNCNIYMPEYHVNQCISDELKEEIKDDYEGAQSLLYDTEEKLKIYYVRKKGLMIDFLETRINVKPDNSIFIDNPNGDNIELTNEGVLTINLKSDAILNCDNIKVTAKGNMDATIKGDVKIDVDGKVNATIGGNLDADVSGDAKVKVKGNMDADITKNLNVKCINAKIKATAKATIDSPQIKLGASAAESVIKGNTFQALFNSHFHISPFLGLPTTPPTVPLVGAELSVVTKTM